MLNTNYIPVKRITISGEQRYCFVPKVNKEYIFKGKRVRILSIDSDLENLKWCGKKSPKMYIKLTIADAQGQIKKLRILGNSCRLWKCCLEKSLTVEEKFDKAIRAIIMTRQYGDSSVCDVYKHCANDFYLSQIPSSLVNDLKTQLFDHYRNHVYYLIHIFFEAYLPKNSLLDGTSLIRYILNFVEEAFPDNFAGISFLNFKNLFYFSQCCLKKIDTSVNYKIDDDGISKYFEQKVSIKDIIGGTPPEINAGNWSIHDPSERNREFYFNNLCGEQL